MLLIICIACSIAMYTNRATRTHPPPFHHHKKGKNEGKKLPSASKKNYASMKNILEKENKPVKNANTKINKDLF